MAASWRKARSDFFALPFGQKLANCRMLIQPVIPDPSGHGFTLNADAFDTWGLFQGSAVWTRVPPWHGPCGTPGTTSSDVCDAFDPLHECDTVCSDAVQVGSECWLMGTVNYGLFGVAMRACHDWASPLELLLPFSASMFSLPATMSLVGAYKLLKGDNIVGPEKWASKTWALGPSAVASGGNRPNCGTTCPGPAPPPFLIVWEPNMPRSGMPVGSPYTC